MYTNISFNFPLVTGYVYYGSAKILN